MAPVLAADRAAENDLGVASYFEVHVRRDTRWTIDCTAPTAAEATAEAEDIARRLDVLAVKVVNERYNPRTEQSAARVVFKLEKPERKRRSGPLRMIAAPRVVPAPPPVVSGPSVTEPDSPVAAAVPGSIAAATGSEPAAPPSAVVPHLRRSPGGLGAAPAPTAPWLLFAWASLALALGASALFVLLLVIG